MKRIIAIVLAMVLVLTVGALPAMAAKGDNPANDNPNNLYLYQKDANWDIVWGGAWGKLNFKLSGTTLSGVFNGHGLVPGTEYSLISYNDPWPGTPVTIASGTANNGGNINLAGTADLGKSSNIKIWLVLTSDLGVGGMIGWHPAEYLFEHNLIP